MGYERLITRNGMFYKDHQTGVVTTEVPILSRDLLEDVKILFTRISKTEISRITGYKISSLKSVFSDRSLGGTLDSQLYPKIKKLINKEIYQKMDPVEIIRLRKNKEKNILFNEDAPVKIGYNLNDILIDENLQNRVREFRNRFGTRQLCEKSGYSRRAITSTLQYKKIGRKLVKSKGESLLRALSAAGI